jgi:hypothetical protein
VLAASPIGETWGMFGFLLVYDVEKFIRLLTAGRQGKLVVRVSSEGRVPLLCPLG